MLWPLRNFSRIAKNLAFNLSILLALFLLHQFRIPSNVAHHPSFYSPLVCSSVLWYHFRVWLNFPANFSSLTSQQGLMLHGVWLESHKQGDCKNRTLGEKHAILLLSLPYLMGLKVHLTLITPTTNPVVRESTFILLVHSLLLLEPLIMLTAYFSQIAVSIKFYIIYLILILAGVYIDHVGYVKPSMNRSNWIFAGWIRWTCCMGCDIQ